MFKMFKPEQLTPHVPMNPVHLAAVADELVKSREQVHLYVVEMIIDIVFSDIQ
jgi:hypothetical protein